MQPKNNNVVFSPFALSKMRNKAMGKVRQKTLRRHDFPMMVQVHFLLKQLIAITAPKAGPIPSQSCNHIACLLPSTIVGNMQTETILQATATR